MILLLHFGGVSGIIRVVWRNQIFKLIFDIPVAAHKTAGFSTGKTGARVGAGCAS